MKYIDVNSVLKSYEGFQDCMTNKSWGYLALLKGCNNCIQPSTPYEIDLDEVSNFLENIFNLNQTKKQYSGDRSLFVVFSNKWDRYFNDQGRHTPNIYDVAVWAYRRNAFDDNVLASIMLDPVILDSISKLLTLLFTCNQFILSDPLKNIYSNPNMYK